MHDLSFTSIKTLREKLHKKEITETEVLSQCLKRFADHDARLGTALEVFDQASIEKTKRGTGILSGIPGLLKDNICQKGRIASCASKILEHYVAPYDATVTSRALNAGAFIVGRANMDEFAMGSSTETSAFKKTKNPWDITRVPGGSSGGSIAAVAAGLVPWALGTETGGSVRQPASLCGIVGLKPTYGLISRNGVVAYGSSLDQVGITTRSVYDCALVLSALAGQDSHDSTTLARSAHDYTRQLDGKLKDGFTLGVIDNALEAEGFDEDVYKALNDAISVYEKMGARIKRITLPAMDHGAAVYFVVSRAEAASNLARFDGVKYGFRAPQADTLSRMYTQTRHDGFGLEVRSRILIGNYVLSAGHADEYYKNAKIVQSLIRSEFVHAFKEVDMLFCPVSPAPAFKFGAFDQNKLQMDLQDYFTAPANLAGIPSLAVPCGFTKEGLPVGFQLMGPDVSEEELFRAAYAYEQATPWHTKHPSL